MPRGSAARRTMAALRAWNPVEVLFGPIFERDMRMTGRQRGTYITRAVYLLVVIGVVILAYWSMRSQMFLYSPASRLQKLQELAPAIAVTVAWVQYLAIGLLAPSLTAGAISDERRAGSLATLLATPLTAAQIVFGKLTGRITLLCILALSTAPLLLAVRIFGGVDARAILAATAVALATAILGAAFGILQSSSRFSNKPGVALAGFYLMIANIAPFALAAAVDHPVFNANTHWVRVTCSPIAMFAISQEILEGGATIGNTTALWTGNVGYNLALALTAGLVASARLGLASRFLDAPKSASRKRGKAGKQGSSNIRSVPAATQSPAAGGSPSVPSADAATPTDAIVSFSESPPPPAPSHADDAAAVRTRDRQRTVGDNPVLWRELRQSHFLRWWHGALAVGAVLALLIFLYFRVGFDDEGLHYSTMIIATIAVLLQSAVQTTSGMAVERDARTLPVLLATPMTPQQILTGKYLGTLRRNWIVPALMVFHLVVSVAADVMHPASIVLVPMVLIGPMMFLSGTGVLFSVLFKRATTAATLNMLVGIGLWLASWMGIFMLGVITAFTAFESLAKFNYAINPVSMMYSIIEAMLRDRNAPFSFSIGFQPLGAGAFFGILIGNVVGYSLLGVGAVALASRIFRQIMQRRV